jgi:hypothetical protein
MRQARSYDGDGSRDAFAAAMRQANVTLTLTAKITPGAATETVCGAHCRVLAPTTNGA